MKRNVLFQSDHIKVILQDFGTNAVVVTFNEAGFPADGDAYWGDTYFEQIQQSAIGVMSTSPNWYPPACMMKAMPAIRSAIGARRVVTYGFSQGGYGALKFSRQLGASVALAFSPKWSINPDEVGDFDKSKAMYYRPDLRNGHRIESTDVGGEIYIFYDPLQKNDQNHVNFIEKTYRSNRVLMPFTGHETIRLLTESRTADLVLSHFFRSDMVDVGFLRQIIRNARRSSNTYRLQKSEYLLRRLNRSHQSTCYIKQHITSLPADEALLTTAFFALHQNDFSAAEFALNQMSDVDLAPRAVWLWNWCRQKGFLSGEKRAATVLRTQFPHLVFERLHVVSTLIQSGEAASATDELEHVAFNMTYDFRDMMALMLQLCSALQRPDIFHRAANRYIENQDLPPSEAATIHAKFHEYSQSFAI